MPVWDVNSPPLANLLGLGGEAVSLFMSRCKTPSQCEYVRNMFLIESAHEVHALFSESDPETGNNYRRLYSCESLL